MGVGGAVAVGTSKNCGSPSGTLGDEPDPAKFELAGAAVEEVVVVRVLRGTMKNGTDGVSSFADGNGRSSLGIGRPRTAAGKLLKDDELAFTSPWMSATAAGSGAAWGLEELAASQEEVSLLTLVKVTAVTFETNLKAFNEADFKPPNVEVMDGLRAKGAPGIGPAIGRGPLVLTTELAASNGALAVGTSRGTESATWAVNDDVTADGMSVAGPTYGRLADMTGILEERLRLRIRDIEE